MRRRRWEAEVTAAAVVEKLAQAFDGAEAGDRKIGVSKPEKDRQAQGQGHKFITLKDGRRAQVVSPEAFLSIAGSP